MAIDAAPEKKIKLEVEDVYVFEINHWEGCYDSGNCACLSHAEDRFEKGWNVPQKTDKDGFKYKDSKKIATALVNVVSSLPSWHVKVRGSEGDPSYEGSAEYRIRKFTGVRQSIVECFELLFDPNSREAEYERFFYLMDRGWLPLTEKTSDDPLELLNNEELDEWIAETKELAQKYV